MAVLDISALKGAKITCCSQPIAGENPFPGVDASRITGVTNVSAAPRASNVTQSANIADKTPNSIA